MVNEPLTLTAAFVAGLAGAAHCVAMCGGIAGALGGASAHPRRNAVLLSVGRVAGYMVAGAIAGGVGITLATALSGTGAASMLRIGFGLVLILIGLRTLTGWRGPRWLEDAGLATWRRVAPTAAALARRPGILPTLGLGFLWGCLPCGLVYAMLAASMLAGGALEGALIMGMFGLGTVPAVGGMLLFAGGLASWMKGKSWRWVAGGLLVAFGLWTAAVPLMH